jgi:hypothetical protein
MSNLNFVILIIYGWYYLFRNCFFIRSIYHYILYTSDVVSLRYRIYPILKYRIKSIVLLKIFNNFLFFRYLYHFYVFLYFNIDLVFLENNEKYYWWHYFYNNDELFAKFFVGKLVYKDTNHMRFYQYYEKGKMVKMGLKISPLNYLWGHTFRDKAYTKYRHPKIARYWRSTSPYVISFLLAYEVWNFRWVEHHDQDMVD